MTSSVVNFDRDLQYLSPGEELNPLVTAGGNPLNVATPGFQVKNSMSVHRAVGAALAIPDNNYACAGVVMSNPGTTSKRVYRARGFVAASDGQFVALAVGYSGDPISASMTSSAQQYVTVGVDTLRFDETIAVDAPDTLNPALPATDNLLIYIVVFNGTPGQVDKSVLYSLSVQDLAVAPPEYDAARR